MTLPSTPLLKSSPCKSCYSPPPSDTLSTTCWLTLQNTVFSVSAASALHQAVISSCSGRWCRPAGGPGLTLALLQSLLHSQARLLFLEWKFDSVTLVLHVILLGFPLCWKSDPYFSPGATGCHVTPFRPLCPPPILKPHWSCFHAFRVFFTVPSSDRNQPSGPQMLHWGPVSLLFPDTGILLLAFWSHMEWRWPGESCCCGHEPTFYFCCWRCPRVSEPLGLSFPRECTSSLPGGGGGPSSAISLLRVHTTYEITD